MQIVFRTFVENTSKEHAFNLIANIDEYDSWLPPSKEFLGIRHISDQPVKQGTIYTDGQGTRRMSGEITVFSPPEQIVFHQASDFRAFGVFPLGLDITIDYILVQEHNGITIIRNYEVDFKGILRVLRPIVIPRIKTENERILHVLKNVLEKTY